MPKPNEYKKDHAFDPKKAISDTRFIRREWYNPGKWPIEFIRVDAHADFGGRSLEQICQKLQIPLGAQRFVLEVDTFAIVPHGFYAGQIVGSKEKNLIQIIEKFGKAIGDGTKNPSPPEVFGRSWFGH